MGSPPNAACAACKFQRRKCAAECPLAPWFPPDQPKRFANVHKLFGVANVLKLFRENQGNLEALVRSIVYEAEARERDPVNGAYGTLQMLQEREEFLLHQKERLTRVRDVMEMEEMKLSRHQMYLPLTASPQYGSGSVASSGLGATSAYLNYTPHGSVPASALWEMQMGMTTAGLQSSYGKQPQTMYNQYGGVPTPDQAYYYGVGGTPMYLSPPHQFAAQRSQDLQQTFQQHFQNPPAVICNQEPEIPIKGNSMIGVKSDHDNQHYDMRNFLSLTNNRNLNF
ncbi:hypothetical protein R1flu_021677 [Riccia fluitans]|uniref:LOB domain-containing protein n=1 Tax=Riccia fluitans TaxID=41844 RepID=A0ABD1ZQ29_9MARC